MLKRIVAGALEFAYHETGPADGPPVILLHGFPYDVHAYDEVAERLAAAGRRCIVPFLRGYGPTRFLDADTMRSGQQAALAADLLALMDALGLPSAVLGGYDWGGRAACIVAALHPERARGLVTCGAVYNIQDIPGAAAPGDPEQEHRSWYVYYLNTERGRAGLDVNRDALCRLMWRLWSPSWACDEATFARSAAAFANPDFVEVVVHSYRHRLGNVAGDPAFEAVERVLAGKPSIGVPTVALLGADDGVTVPKSSEDAARHFSGPYRAQLVPGAGHNLPQEKPAVFADAVLSLG